MIEGLSRREAAKRFGVHRNTITKMLSFSVPPGYRRRERPASKKLGPFMAWIDAILEGDRKVHKKQRHTAHRIFERLRDEQGFTGGYTIVREYVAAAVLRLCVASGWSARNHKKGMRVPAGDIEALVLNRLRTLVGIDLAHQPASEF